MEICDPTEKIQFSPFSISGTSTLSMRSLSHVMMDSYSIMSTYIDDDLAKLLGTNGGDSIIEKKYRLRYPIVKQKELIKFILDNLYVGKWEITYFCRWMDRETV